ncbi:hypothetical protein MJ561_21760 [Klebsiella pneumoniae]|nr:hypothetical protein MJ561_21760 [Klebsiella pneumoniae]
MRDALFVAGCLPGLIRRQSTLFRHFQRNTVVADIGDQRDVNLLFDKFERPAASIVGTETRTISGAYALSNALI